MELGATPTEASLAAALAGRAGATDRADGAAET
jgi:hypothetical protein